MKLHSTVNQFYQTVTAYDVDSVKINDVQFTSSLIVTPTTAPVVWPVNHYQAINTVHLEQILATSPDLVILGTGQQQHFLNSNMLKPFMQQRVGIEMMSNDAACRTYNILMSEGRKVTLCLIFE